MSKLLSQATDLEILTELISRNGHERGPNKVVQFGKRECLVGIGKDFTARITFDEEALPELGLE